MRAHPQDRVRTQVQRKASHGRKLLLAVVVVLAALLGAPSAAWAHCNGSESGGSFPEHLFPPDGSGWDIEDWKDAVEWYDNPPPPPPEDPPPPGDEPPPTVLVPPYCGEDESWCW